MDSPISDILADWEQDSTTGYLQDILQNFFRTITFRGIPNWLLTIVLVLFKINVALYNYLQGEYYNVTQMRI